jgi:hypothetical protein
LIRSIGSIWTATFKRMFGRSGWALSDWRDLHFAAGSHVSQGAARCQMVNLSLTSYRQIACSLGM